jgi:hypothetical protein
MLVSRDEAANTAMKLYLDGHELVNPHVNAIKIENTGRAPIVPDDFDGPISIRLHESIFLSLSISWNRPNILQEDKHELQMSTRELQIGPMLLNPGDVLTVIAVVDTIADDLSVVGRLAGVEQILQIPPSETMAHLRFLNDNYYVGPTKRAAPLPVPNAKLAGKTLDCMRFRWPILANPNGQAHSLLKDIEVRVNGFATSQPIALIYGLSNTTKETILASDFGGPLTIRSRESIFRHAYARRKPPLEDEDFLPIEVRDHEIRVQPTQLERDDIVNVTVILDGAGDDLDVSSPSLPIIVGSPMTIDPQSLLSVDLDYNHSLKHRLNRFLTLPRRNRLPTKQ